MKKFFDVTLDLSEETIIYPGDPKFEKEYICSIDMGDSFNISSIAMGSHTGTHIDAPRHFYKDGDTIDSIEIEKLIGEAKVIDLLEAEEINKEILEKFYIEEGDRILFKTRNSKILRENRYEENFVSLTKDGAEYLIEKNIKLVGIDYLSIEGINSEFNDVHLLLLKNNIVIIEGVDLLDVPHGEYNMSALPLKIKGGDGAPARVILWT
ncbi:cyclase family protein [Clostridium hydrogeniformans]|uniref:cyclase family protein n=1 Tax=Clostridium hydrogeniformans TaxID=349933 RepID=UPI00048972F1|nr:cyclase family protein [Clostridium hydrogeniformans]